MIKILKFYADWCGPCVRLDPIIENGAKIHGIEVQSLDIDANPEMVAKYKVRGIPTTVFLKDDVPVMAKLGLFTSEQFEEFVECLNLLYQ